MRVHISEDGKIRPCEAKSPESCTARSKDGGKAEHFNDYDEALDYIERTERLFSPLTRKEIRSAETTPTILKHSYVGGEVPSEHLHKYEEELISLKIPNMDVYMKNRLERDRGGYHVTFIRPVEFRRLKKEGRFPLTLPESVNFNFVGVGSVKDEERDLQAWYVVLESPEIDSWRSELGLPPHGLHITLAFKNSDIHNQVKDKTTLLQKESVCGEGF